MRAGNGTRYHRQYEARMVHEIELDIRHRPLERHQGLPVHLMKGPGLHTQQLLNSHTVEFFECVTDPPTKRRVGALDAPAFCRQQHAMIGFVQIYLRSKVRALSAGRYSGRVPKSVQYSSSCDQTPRPCRIGRGDSTLPGFGAVHRSRMSAMP